MNAAIVRSRELRLNQILVHSIIWIWHPASLKYEQVSWIKPFVVKVWMIRAQKNPEV